MKDGPAGIQVVSRLEEEIIGIDEDGEERWDAGRACADQSRRSAGRPGQMNVNHGWSAAIAAPPQMEPELAALCAPAVPYGDDTPGVSHDLVREGVTGSLVGHVEAALVGAHVPIMLACWHRSSCRYSRSASPTFAR
jgi:hypothetical protein